MAFGFQFAFRRSPDPLALSCRVCGHGHSPTERPTKRSLNFLVANGYTGQTTENFFPSDVQEVVGGRILPVPARPLPTGSGAAQHPSFCGNGTPAQALSAHVHGENAREGGGASARCRRENDDGRESDLL